MADEEREPVPNRVYQLIEKCIASRQMRREKYAYLRLWYGRGTDAQGSPARYNKLESHTDTVTSYLYTPDSTRFYLHMSPDLIEDWRWATDGAREAFETAWREIGADVLFQNVVEFALVYGTNFVKVLPDEDGHVQIVPINPGDIGVLREDIVDLEKQEVICHFYGLSLPELERMVEGLPDAKKIMEVAKGHSTQHGDSSGTLFPRIVQQIIVTNVSGSFPSQNTQGMANLLSTMSEDMPENREPMVEMVEVWEKGKFTNDKTKEKYADWMVHTALANGEYVIASRVNPVLPYTKVGAREPFKAEHPFVKICPQPYPDYFWGRSPIQRLLLLQQWRERRMNEADDVMSRHIDPPKFFSGMSIPDEKLKALRSVGGAASTPNPGAKMEAIKPDVKTGEIIEFIHEIDAMFADQGAVPDILSAKPNMGGGGQARSGEQVGALAAIGSGRIRSRALIVEDSLECLATKIFHMLQRHDEAPLRSVDGKRAFTLGQLPPSTSVKVSAHTASPVYAEQTSKMADEMLKAGAIDLETYVELKNPPMKAELKAKARGLQEAKAQQLKEMLRIKELAATRRGRSS